MLSGPLHSNPARLALVAILMILTAILTPFQTILTVFRRTDIRQIAIGLISVRDTLTSPAACSSAPRAASLTSAVATLGNGGFESGEGTPLQVSARLARQRGRCIPTSHWNCQFARLLLRSTFRPASVQNTEGAVLAILSPFSASVVASYVRSVLFGMRPPLWPLSWNRTMWTSLPAVIRLPPDLMDRLD